MALGRAPTLPEKTITGNPAMDRFIEKLRAALQPVFSNPLLASKLFRFNETSAGLVLQYNNGGTTGWSTITTFASSGDLSTAISQDLLTAVGDTIYAGAKGTAARLGIGSTGQVLTVTGGIPVWTTPAAAGGWVTILDLDFTAESSQTLTTDGNYTIGGLVWKKENSANDSTAMAVTNGAGLVVIPKSTTDYVNATRTLPLVWLKVANLGIPNLSWSTGLRIWAYVSASNHAANYDNAVIALDSDNMNLGITLFRGYDANNVPGMWLRRTISSSSSAGTVDATLDTTNNVMVLATLNSLVGPYFHDLAGGYSSGWPAETALKFIVSYTDGSGAGAVAGTAPAAGNAPGNYGIVLGAMRAGSATALSVTFARLRVDYRL